MRRVIIILIIVVIIAIIAGVVFALLDSGNGDGEDSPLKNVFPISLLYPDTSSTPGVFIPGSGGGSGGYTEETDEYAEGSAVHPIPLSQEEIYGYWVSSSTAFFLTKDGDLKKNDGTGEFSLLSHSYGIPLRVKQNLAGTAAAVKFDSGSTYLYIESRNAWEFLGNAISDFAFSPDGNSLLALEERGSEMSMVRHEPFTTPKRAVTLLRMSGVDLRVQWPSANRAVLSSVPSYYAESQIWEINLQTQTFRKIAVGSGMSAITSPFVTRTVVFTPESKQKMVARLYASDGTQVNSYSRMLLEAKCGASLSDPIVWCGAPQLVPADAHVFPDDYLQREVFTHDELAGIALDTGEFFTIPFRSDSYVDMSGVKHSNGVVYFINRLDDRLYKLEVGL